MAHTPTDMTLDFNYDTQVLTVTVSHVVADPGSHYIETITVEVNDVEVVSRDYTSQESASQASDTFSITAFDGDVISVLAECSISGSISRDLTVTAPATTTTTATETTTTTDDGTTETTTPPPDGAPDYLILSMVIGGLIVVIGIIFVFIAIVRRR